MPDVKTRSELLAAAREIVEKAKIENRGLSADEQSSVDSHLDAVRARDAEQATDARAAADAKSKELLGALDQMASGRYQGQRDDSRRLCFGKSMSESAARKILAPEYGGQIKALAPSGSVLVDQEFSPDPISLGRVAQGLLDVLPVRQHSSPEYAFIRQGATGRTVNAAVVAPGALKPTSPLGLERVEQTLSVVAHLSELINRYWLLDAPSVAAFIDADTSIWIVRCCRGQSRRRHQRHEWCSNPGLFDIGVANHQEEHHETRDHRVRPGGNHHAPHRL